MKDHHPNPFTGKNLLSLLIVLFLIVNLQSLFGQKHDFGEEDSIIWMDGNEATKGVSFTASNDDKSITFSWSGFSNPCPVGPLSTTIKLYQGDFVTGSRTEIGIIGRSNTGSYKYTVGPRHNLDERYYYQIKAFFTGFWCTGFNGFFGLIAKTDNIYPPQNVDATYDKYDNRIVVKWDASTTSLLPHEYGYRVTRNDGSIVDEVSPGTLTVPDTEPYRGITETYKVVVYSPAYHNWTSSVRSDTGRIFDLNVRTVSKHDGVEVRWTKADVLADNPTKFIIERRAEGEGRVNVKTADGMSITAAQDIGSSEEAPYPGYTYMYIVTPENNTRAFRPDSATGLKFPNGQISGIVDTRSGGKVAGAVISAERIDSVPQGEMKIYYDTTNAEGEYVIEDVYYFTEAHFKIIPSMGDHVFDPVADTVKLELQRNTVISDFKDESSFSVKGMVFQVFGGDTCAQKGVEILIDGIPKDYKTDEAGMYNLTVPTTDEYTFKPTLFDHLFDKEDTTMFVNEDIDAVNFQDTTMYKLNGKVSGPCDIYIGKADLRSFSINGACIDTTIQSDAEGNYEIDLPARIYCIEMVTFYPTEPPVATSDEVKFYFSGIDSLDLRESGQVKDWVFRRDPVLEVSGFQTWGCGSYNVPIIELGQSETLFIKVKEIFGEDWCYADTGFIVVVDETVNEGPRIDTFMLESGLASYVVVPGYPNFISPHLRLLEITAYVGDASDKYSQQILVTGNKPRTSDFATVSPEIPFMILRDPPGDGSRSYLEKSSTSKYSMSMALERSSSLNVWGEVKLGVEYEAGQFIFTEFKVWGSVKATLEVGASLKNSEELELSITNGQEFSTSGNESVIGVEGDVFAGAALNIQYALTDILEYDPKACDVVQDVDIIMGVNGFETTFLYTENHIREVLLGQLASIRDIYASEGSDSAIIYENQIRTWQDILDMNDELKQKAKPNPNPSPENPGNISFSAHAPVGYFTEISKSETLTIEYSLYIEAAVAVEAGVEIGGAGFSGGIEVKAKMELGGSESIGTELVQKTGFELNDDDLGDAFTVDILEDKVYGTPVFRLVSGRSSCPWEPGTLPREGVELTANTYSRYIENPDDPAVFTLKMANTSESDEDNTYNLVFLQQSNPDGASLTLGGSEVQGGIPTPYEIPSGSFVNATVTVSRGLTAYDYNNLRFRLESACDGAISDEVALTVKFNSPCSSVSIKHPGNNWLVTSNDDNLMKILVFDYDTANMEAVELQYSKAGMNAWTTLAYYDNNLLEESETEMKWNMDNIDDGEYDLRAMVKCASSWGYSAVLTGVVDRRAPKVFGTPEPADGVINKGDLISVRFDEPINCQNISIANVRMTNTETEEVIPVQVGCYDDELIILPNTAGMTFEDVTFRVKVIGVEDLYGNRMQDTVTWLMDAAGASEFEIGLNEDTDLDGIVNNSDNCPIAYNPEQEDMDGDNEGDQCDSDIDGDLVENSIDNCPLASNADQADQDGDGIGDACEATDIGPALDVTGKYHLFDNYPNPFADFTTIEYEAAGPCLVTLKVYSILGRTLEVLFDGNNEESGRHQVRWETEGRSSGIYFYSILVRDPSGYPLFSDFKKMILSE